MLLVGTAVGAAVAVGTGSFVGTGAWVGSGTLVMDKAGVATGAQALKGIANNNMNTVVFVVILVILLSGWTWQANKLNKRLNNIFFPLILDLSWLGLITLDHCALSIKRYPISPKNI
jgi:hypothetical protein